MKYLIKIKDEQIPLIIQNYKTAKSIKIYFKEDTLKITKSPYISKKQVDKLLEKNEEKIYQGYKKIQELKSLRKEIWETGETILYHGEKYIIKKEYHELNIVRVRIEEKEKIFKILLPKQIQKEEEEYYIKKAVKILFKENTEAIIAERLPYFSKVTNISYSSYKVQDAKTKYGSCVPCKRALHFSSRLIMLKKEAIDAVIVHELCHIVYSNHSKEFYNLVEKYIPDYKEINKYLKQNSKNIII